MLKNCSGFQILKQFNISGGKTWDKCEERRTRYQGLSSDERRNQKRDNMDTSVLTVTPEKYKHSLKKQTEWEHIYKAFIF